MGFLFQLNFYRCEWVTRNTNLWFYQMIPIFKVPLQFLWTSADAEPLWTPEHSFKTTGLIRHLFSDSVKKKKKVITDICFVLLAFSTKSLRQEGWMSRYATNRSQPSTSFIFIKNNFFFFLNSMIFIFEFIKLIFLKVLFESVKKHFHFRFKEKNS